MQSEIPEQVRQRVLAVKAKFPTSLELIKGYNPNLQHLLSRKGYTAGLLALNKDIPSLAVIRIGYGDQTAQMWLEAQIMAVADNTETKAKLNEQQCIELSKLILAHFYYLNLAELSFFFGKLRSGAYGKFYGSISQDSITSALRTYEKERKQEITEIEDKRQQAIDWEKRQQWTQEAVTREEYLAMVSRGEIKPLEYE